MPNIITNKLRIDNANGFKDRVSLSSGNSLYMFLAKPNKWEDDDLPPDPIDTQDFKSKTWDEMISLKRILPDNICSIVKRINWTAGEIYAAYDNEDSELYVKEFYVLNSEFNVYKCIDNDNNSPSTSEPTGRNLNIVTLADKYRWKYLYSISTSDQLKFLTNNWMPVFKNQEVADTAKGGAIESIKINNGGSDYSVRSSIVIIGDGANAIISPKLSLGVIYDFSYTKVGDGYRYATATVSDPTTSGRYANLRPIISPLNGHGYDPVYELNSNYVMINVKTEYNEGFGDFPSSFSYRKIGIIKNPIDRYKNIANASTLNALSGIYLGSSSGSFLQNEHIEGTLSLSNAYVVASNIVAGNGYIKYIQTKDLTSNYTNFLPGEVVIGTVSGTTAVVSNTAFYSEVVQDTGDIFYIENRTPITRSLNQIDNLHLVLEF
jgi:hypothetical protein